MTVLLLLLLAPAAGAAESLPAAKRDPGDDVARLRTQMSQTFEATGGSYEVRVGTESLNYRDAQGRWQPVDNRLTAAGDVLRNAANRYRLRVPQRLGQEPVRVSVGDAWIEFAPVGAVARPAQRRGDEAAFAGAWPGVELTYTATGDTVKESLVVSDRSRIQDFAFDLRVPEGGTLVEEQAGSIAVRDHDGKIPLRLSASTMVDAAGEMTGTPTRLRKTVAGWRLVIVPDRAWLDEPGRKWPVTIDPTVDTSAPASLGCMIWDGGGSQCGQPLSVSRWIDRDSGRVLWDQRALARFDLTSVLPPGAVVEHALITTEPGATSSEWGVAAILEPWNQNLTWETRDGSTPWSYGPGTPAYAYTADTTALVRRWHSGEQPNYGIFVESPTDSGASYSVEPVLHLQYAPTDDPDGLQDTAAEWYAAKFGVTIEEAKRRLRIQDRFGNLTDELEDAIAVADFGDMWIDDFDQGRPKVGIKSTSSPPPGSKTAAARSVLTDHDLLGEVDFVAVAHNLSELEAAADDLTDNSLAALAAANKVTTSIDSQHNAVELEKGNALTSSEEAQVSAAVAASPVPVTVVTADTPTLEGEDDACDTSSGWLQCDNHLRGGMTIENDDHSCSVGFNAIGTGGRHPQGAHYVLTGGHCIRDHEGEMWKATTTSDTEIDIGRATLNDWEYGPRDVGVVPVPTGSFWYDEHPPAYIFVDKQKTNGTSTRYDESYNIRFANRRVPQNRVVCISSGAELPGPGFKHTECGRVEKLAQKKGPLRGLARVEFCGGHGASGGPVYKNHIAYGLWQSHKNTIFGGCKYGRFQGILAAQSVMDVRVVTNP